MKAPLVVTSAVKSTAKAAGQAVKASVVGTRAIETVTVPITHDK